MSGSHTVAPGETLSGIAAKYDLELDDLIKWNNLDNPDLITPGQEIELSGHLPDVPEFTEYVVVAGDTLSEIAQAHGTTVAALQEVNDIPDPDVITAGQTLKIPAAAG